MKVSVTARSHDVRILDHVETKPKMYSRRNKNRLELIWQLSGRAVLQYSFYCLDESLGSKACREVHLLDFGYFNLTLAFIRIKYIFIKFE